MNTLNQFALTINDKPIKKVEDEKKHNRGKFLSEVWINGKLRTQWTSDLFEYINQCNESGWQIEQVTMFILPKTKEVPANADLYNKR